MKKKMLLGIGIVILLPVLILGIARYIAIPTERGCCQERLHPLSITGGCILSFPAGC